MEEKSVKPIKKEDGQKANKKGRWIIIAIIIGVCALLFSGALLLKANSCPKPPTDLSSTPNPLFVVDHYVSGEIMGIIEKHSFPKGATMEITPFLESGGSRYYGDSFVLHGENIQDENATTISYSNNERIAHKFNILCPTYDDKFVLLARIDLISASGKSKTVIKKISEVMTYNSIIDTYSKKLAPWKKARNITFLISIIGLLLIIAGIRNWLFFEEWSIKLGAGIFIISLIVLIPFISRISHANKEKVILLHSLDNAQQIVKIRNSIQLKEQEAHSQTATEVASDTLSIVSTTNPQKGKKKGLFRKNPTQIMQESSSN